MHYIQYSYNKASYRKENTVKKIMSKWVSKSLSGVPLFTTHGLYSPWNSPGQNTGMGSLSLLQGIFPTQGSNPKGREKFIYSTVFIHTVSFHCLIQDASSVSTHVCVVSYDTKHCRRRTFWRTTLHIKDGKIMWKRNSYLFRGITIRAWITKKQQYGCFNGA